MDSVTQIALGSAVGYVALGNQIGRRALLVGAVFGTLPDLDVLIDFGGAVENFVYHRSFSHSLFVQLILSPIFALLLSHFSWAKPISFRRLSAALFLIMSTHALLDSFTVYGTQLLWPLTTYPFGISSVFIIDPMYTLPLFLVGVVSCFSRFKSKAYHLNLAALGISSTYLLWSVLAKAYIDQQITSVLERNNIIVEAYESTPAPFNTLLWRAIATVENGHYEIYTSVFDTPEQLSMRFIQTHNHLLDEIETTEQVGLLQAFTKGLYGVYLEQDLVVLSDLRMGLEGFYVFSFAVAEQGHSGMKPSDYRQLENRPPLEQINLVFERITNPNVDLSTLGHKVTR